MTFFLLNLHMPLALGLVETKGLVAAIEAADAMAKASSVRLIGSERINPALITIKVVGDVAAVKASVEAGAAAAARVGQVVSVHIIPNPDRQLSDLFPEIIQDEITSASSDEEEDASFTDTMPIIEEFPPSEKIESENEPDIVSLEPSIEALPNAEVVSEGFEQNAEIVAIEVDLPQVIEDEAGDIATELNVVVDAVEETPADGGTQDEIPIAIEEYIDGSQDLDIENEDTDEPDEIIFEEQEYNYLEDDTYQSDIPNPDAVIEYEEITYRPESELTIETKDNNFDEVKETPIDEELHQTFVDVFAVEPENSVEEFIPDDDFSFEDLFAQAERIEKEKGKKKQISPSTKKEVAINTPEVIREATDSEPVISNEIEEIIPTVSPTESDLSATIQPDLEDTQEVVTAAETDHELEELKNKPLETMNVHQLRRLARSTASFPIQGREISKANRQELLYYFNALS